MSKVDVPAYATLPNSGNGSSDTSKTSSPSGLRMLFGVGSALICGGAACLAVALLYAVSPVIFGVRVAASSVLAIGGIGALIFAAVRSRRDDAPMIILGQDLSNLPQSDQRHGASDEEQTPADVPDLIKELRPIDTPPAEKKSSSDEEEESPNTYSVRIELSPDEEQVPKDVLGDHDLVEEESPDAPPVEMEQPPDEKQVQENVLGDSGLIEEESPNTYSVRIELSPDEEQVPKDVLGDHDLVEEESPDAPPVEMEQPPDEKQAQENVLGNSGLIEEESPDTPPVEMEQSPDENQVQEDMLGYFNLIDEEASFIYSDEVPLPLNGSGPPIYVASLDIDVLRSHNYDSLSGITPPECYRVFRLSGDGVNFMSCYSFFQESGKAASPDEVVKFEEGIKKNHIEAVIDLYDGNYACRSQGLYRLNTDCDYNFVKIDMSWPKYVAESLELQRGYQDRAASGDDIAKLVECMQTMDKIFAGSRVNSDRIIFCSDTINQRAVCVAIIRKLWDVAKVAKANGMRLLGGGWALFHKKNINIFFVESTLVLRFCGLLGIRGQLVVCYFSRYLVDHQDELFPPPAPVDMGADGLGHADGIQFPNVADILTDGAVAGKFSHAGDVQNGHGVPELGIEEVV
jgi:hypothetical protein